MCSLLRATPRTNASGATLCFSDRNFRIASRIAPARSAHFHLVQLPVISRAKIRCAAILFLLTIGVRAESVSQLKPTGYVNDFAHVIDQGTAAQMEDVCKQIDDKAHAQITVVTINTLGGRDIESYAVDLFHQWGIGAKATNRGVLILYVIRDRRARIEVGYGLEPILPDGKVGSFQREAIPLMRGGNYSEALLLVTTGVADVIASDAGVQITHAQPRVPAQPENPPEGGLSIGGILLIIIVILIVLFTPLRTLLFWILFSNIFGGRRGGWGGGGFGGFGGGGGGGGFGGFGGGSSGGGGASSSW
jgi:uncharacterized protein